VVVTSVPRFERFVRETAGVDVDKADVKRYAEFVNQKLYDLLLVGQAHAGANGRDIVESWDLPVTKGLQETIHDFRQLDEKVELRPILEQLATLPPLDRPLSGEAEARLPELVGGLSLALARTFTIVDPKLKNPSTKHWEQAFRIFDLLI
jgi:Domain of unknown function (DUF1931)